MSYPVEDAFRLPKFPSAVMENFAVGAEAFNDGSLVVCVARRRC